MGDQAKLGKIWRPYWTPTEEQAAIDGNYTAKDIVIENRAIIPDFNMAEGLKLSFPNNVEVKNCTIHGGYEDVVDIVRGVNVKFKECLFIGNSKTKQFFTVKGGVKNVSVEDCEFEGTCKGKYVFNLGDWTDYDHWKRPKVRNVTIKNCKFDLNSKKKLYRRIYSETPKLINNDISSGCKVSSLVVKVYWLFQKIFAKKAPNAADRVVYPIEQ